jgi:hypothetical protein
MRRGCPVLPVLTYPNYNTIMLKALGKVDQPEDDFCGGRLTDTQALMSGPLIWTAVR